MTKYFRTPEELWNETRAIANETADNKILKHNIILKAHRLSDEAIEIAKRRREAKVRGYLDSSMIVLKKQVGKDKYVYPVEECLKVEGHRVAGHTRNIFQLIKEVARTDWDL